MVKTGNGNAINAHVTTGKIQLRFAYNLTLIRMHATWMNLSGASIDMIIINQTKD